MPQAGSSSLPWPPRCLSPPTHSPRCRDVCVLPVRLCLMHGDCCRADECFIGRHRGDTLTLLLPVCSIGLLPSKSRPPSCSIPI